MYLIIYCDVVFFALAALIHSNKRLEYYDIDSHIVFGDVNEQCPTNGAASDLVWLI